MPDKKLHIETELEPKVSPKFEQVYRQAVKQTFGNIKEVDRFVKSLEQANKGAEKSFQIDKKHFQLIRNEGLRALKEKEQSYHRLGAEMQRVGTNMERIDRLEKRIASGAVRVGAHGMTLEQLRSTNPGIAAAEEARMMSRLGSYRAGFSGQMMQGAEFVANRAREEQIENSARRM